MNSLKTRFAPTQPLMAVLAFALVALVGLYLPLQAHAQSSVRPPENATTSIAPPGPPMQGGVQSTQSDAEIWHDIRLGETGRSATPNAAGGQMIQSQGEDWRLYREGPTHDYLGYAMLATLVLLALFMAIRGRIKVEHGLSGVKIKRFSTLERMSHWLMALSFITLGISGLNVTFGRSLILPLVGKDFFGPMSGFLKATHNYTAFAFMLGLAMAFVLWVVHNIPDRTDLNWLAKGGGLLSKSSHPPAKKFNAGQKVIFWGVMLLGLSLSVSGWALLFPFEHSLFSDTFALFSAIGVDIPHLLGLPAAPYSAIQEQQLNSAWHGIIAVVMICLIFAHIYIGTIGMQGAFDAMGSGEVDLNWAKEHHSIWVDEVMAEETQKADAAVAAPAE
ncbi:formate dehydrogenase gamma subunit [Hoeflea sp. IMCC20628]|uniref:formate dehydrogenase subunit gamma n=1 Tax=Hoeflea sp. IMCC20628 TaxID=1620421 RepID=UPI00063BEB97|nr:formate dehydrogenase subunit gamma [Hoeflea sp. IMCC20628]AKI01999.1 formate dehydrogenase gamma subunit [Hoeflea sp. IMCC20628]